MNGLGIACVVALGVAVGFLIGANRDFSSTEVVLTVLFWSLTIGLIYELWRMAVSSGDKPER
jgi:hypothetical protein